MARLPYAGAKAGKIGCTSQVAKALGPCSIQVNAVMPGGRLTQPDARVAQRSQGLAGKDSRAWLPRGSWAGRAALKR